ncbi:MAG: PKD domain-containing protein [Bacteroidota bacterium]|nr:MAG: PKD domain-containing protein [Bacteroidota bacterium]
MNAQAAPCTNISFTTTQVGDTVSFTPLLPANYVLTNISWNFGDGVGSNQTNPSHIYIATAPYNVCMTVIYSTPTGIDSCWHWESLFVVTSAGLCNASFSYQTGNGTIVNFTNTSTGTGTMSNSMWDFGDGSTSVYNVQNPSHTYASGGWYNVTLQTYYFNINTGIYNSCISNDSIYIQSGQGGPCAADFNYSVSNCTAHFSNYSSGPGILTSCLWDFGDGDTSSSWSPQHTYNATGIYNTCVSVNYLDTTSGTTSTCTYCDSVQWVQCVSVPCFAEYTYNTSGNTLYCNNTSVGNGTITSSHWNFGDGTTSMLTNPNHTYSSAGAYNVCLTVVYTTLVGSDTCTYCNSIQVGGSTPCPNNNFSHTQNGSNTINFYSSVGTNPYSCFWTFGDGTTSTFSFPSHTYSQPGTYIVCLTQVFFTPFGLDTCYHCATIQVAGSTGTCTSSFLPPPSSTGTVNFTNSSSGNGNLVASFGTLEMARPLH